MIHCSLEHGPYIFTVPCRNALLFVVLYPAFHGRYLIGAGLKWGVEIIGPSSTHHKLLVTTAQVRCLATAQTLNTATTRHRRAVERKSDCSHHGQLGLLPVSQTVRVVPAGIIPYGTQGSTLRALALGSAGPPSNPVHLVASSTPLHWARCLLHTPLML
jgi:hypothetical protein